MNRIGILLIVLLWASLTASAQLPTQNQKTYTLDRIEVEGVTFEHKAQVIHASGLALGDAITVPGPQITNAIKNLWATNRYADISIEMDTVSEDKLGILIAVEETPLLQSYSLTGLPKSQAEDLREKIRLVRGGSWTEEKAIRTHRVIRNYFVEKGHYTPTIDITAEKTMTQAKWVHVNIAVDAGPRVKIQEIKLVGNQQFSDAKLKSKMKSVKERKWWRVWKPSKFKPAEYQVAKKEILDFYNDEGYHDASIEFDTVYAPDGKDLEIEMSIREGKQYYFRDIHWVGNVKYRDGFLDTLFGIQKGDVYNQTLMQRRLQGDFTGNDISTIYLDDGYLFFHADPVELRVEGDSIDFEMRITEGPQATIRNIILEGNSKTSDYVILRELRTIPGQKFNRSNLMRSQSEVLSLGFFNQENLQVVPIPDPETGTVDIKYKVEEKPSDRFQLQLGWSPKLKDAEGDPYGGGLVGTINLGFNNFSTKRLFKKREWRPIPAGDGQKLNLAAQLSATGGQNYSLSFLEPWLGGKRPNSLGASVFYTINKNQTNDFQMNTLGATIDYGRRLTWPDDFFRSYTSLSYKYHDLRNGAEIFGTNSDAQIDDGFINVLALKQSIQRSSIDAPIFPRSGSEFNFSVEATLPYSVLGRYGDQDLTDVPNQDKFNLLEYHKWNFSATWYHEIINNLVVRPKVELGFLGSYRKDYGISPFERFVMGGSGFGGANFYGLDYVSLRGYENNSIGAENGGGNIYNKYSLEMRYPISLNQSVPVWALAFAEAGNTWNGVENYDPLDLKRSAGVGVRMVLPMIGLFGVDCGWGFDGINGEPRSKSPVFNFVIGQEF